MNPHIIFLKQTVSTVGMKHWFIELGIDVSQKIGPCLMYTDVDSEQELGDLQILAAPSYSKKSYLHRLWTWLRYFLISIFVVWRHSPRSLLFIVAQPPYLPVIGWLRSLFLGQQYVVWIDDVYPDVIVRHRKLGEKNPIIQVWKRFNRLIYGRAEKIFTLGPYMGQVLSQYLSSDDIKNKLVIVPTWVDTEQMQPIPKEQNPFAIEHNQVGVLTVLYSGNLGLSHDFNTMIEAARQLSNQSDIHFLIIGIGSQWEYIEATTRELDNITLLPYQPVDVIPFSMTTGDVAIVSLDKGLEGVSLPSKTQFMLAAGAALISLGKFPNDVQMIVDKYHCGLSVEPGNVEGFVDAILRFHDEPEFISTCRRNARLAAENSFSRKHNVQRILQEITPLLIQTTKRTHEVTKGHHYE